MELRRRPLGNIDFLSELNIPPLLKRLYVQRGIFTIDELERSTRKLLAYNLLSGIEKAVDLLIGTLISQSKLVVVGDFDVDGAASTVLTVLALQRMGAQKIDFLIPNRFSEGYGLSPAIVEKAESRNAEIILTVDNGISSHDGVDLARKKGMLVIVTDHHSPSDTLPPANAIVNPNLRHCSFPSKSLAGVGVALYLMLALRARLNHSGWFKEKGIQVPKIADLLDLVALGTVVDVVPLDANNRILVHQGLNRIRAGYCRPGIRALAEIANCDLTRLCTSDLSFSLGPRLNAAGRLNDMSISVALLLTDDLSQARIFAAKLDTLNHIRRKIEQSMENQALDLCHKIIRNQQTIPFSLIIYHACWHQGVIGILASRIKDRFQRPVITFAPSGKDDNLLKGSGRSVTGLNILNVLETMNKLYPDLIVKFGGHAMAAALTLEKNKFKIFKQYFYKLVSDSLNPDIQENVIWSDGELIESEFSIAIAELLHNAGPWGKGFPEPLFDGRFLILNQRIIAKRHLKLTLKPLSGGPELDGIAFNIDQNIWPNIKINTVELAYKLKVNRFNSNCKLQLLIEHIWLL